MKRCAMFALACLSLTLAGCNQDRPSISLDNAKKISATFAKDGYVAPPRTVNDILALLDQEKPDPVKAERNRMAADGEPPAGSDLAAFYQNRGLAAAAIGRTRQQIEDYTKAYELASAADTTRIDLSRLLQQLSSAHMRAGNRAESIRYRKMQQAEHEDSGTQQGRLFGVYASLIGILADQGDLDDANSYLDRMTMLLAESHKWGKGRPYAQHGNVWEAQYLTAQAALAEKGGNVAEAERLRRREVAAYDGIVSSPDEDSQRFVINRDLALRNLSRVLSLQNRPVEAEVEARRALINELQAHGRYAPETAEMLLSLTDVVAQQGRWHDAEKLARATIDIYERTGHGPTSWSLAHARANLAMVQMLSDQPAEALASFQSLATDIDSDKTLTRRILAGNMYYADTLLAGGHASEAAAILRAGTNGRANRLGPDHPDTAEARGMLGAALAETGDRPGAMAAFRQAVPTLLAASTQAGQDDLGDGGVGRARRRRLVLEAYIGLLADAAPSDPLAMAEAFRAADTARSQTVQKSLAASAARAATQDPEMAETVRREEDTEQQLAAHRSMLADQLSAPPGQRDEALVSELRGQVEALDDARRALKRDVDSRFPSYAKLRSPPPAAIADVQAALKEGEALVSVLVVQTRSFVWAMRKTGSPAFASVPMGRADVAKMVAKLRVPMEAAISDLGQLPAYDVALAYQAYQAFLAPVEAGWKGANSLMVVADKALGRLPFAILVTEPTTLSPERDGQAFLSSYRPVPWLVRQAAVTQLPSVASLVALRQLPPGPADRRPFIGFADPWFNAEQADEGKHDIASRGAPTKGAGGGEIASRGIMPSKKIATRAFARRAVPATSGLDTARLTGLPRLPETAGEVISVALALHADPAKDVFLGANINERTVMTTPLADRRVVMFATHGLVPGDIDGLSQPALAMSHPDVTKAGGTGLLTMDNVLGLKLNADWVVLSACNTASSDAAGAEAVSGLGRAFFYAGTRAVLVTHWAVESSSAAAITTGLFQRSADTPGLARAEALRQTMLSLIDGPGAIDPDSKQVMYAYAHPIFWAPYALVGDGG